LGDVDLKSPTDLLFKISFFMQRWFTLLGGADRGKLEIHLCHVYEWARSFLADLKSKPRPEDFI
jgi:hypothetical protein